MTKRGLPAPVASGAFEVPTEPSGAYVYRAYCRCGDLLYVGVTNDIFSRMTAHRRTNAAWELKLARLEWDRYRTRNEAERVERHLISTLSPSHNIVNAGPRRSRPVSLPTPRTFTADELNRCAIAAYRGIPYLTWIFTELEVAA